MKPGESVRGSRASLFAYEVMGSVSVPNLSIDQITGTIVLDIKTQVVWLIRCASYLFVRDWKRICTLMCVSSGYRIDKVISLIRLTVEIVVKL